MAISLYAASIPVFKQYLLALKDVLGKAEVQAAAMKVAPGVFLEARLHPTMFPLIRQVQIAADFAKGASARLAGLDLPAYPDTEASFSELTDRIDRTIGFIDSIKPEQINGQEERAVEYKVAGQMRRYEGLPYLLTYALPNFFFHVTTAYAILRHNGIDLAKKDFLGAA
jgi:hypothetical protein